jgi:hypothetical protein
VSLVEILGILVPVVGALGTFAALALSRAERKATRNGHEVQKFDDRGDWVCKKCGRPLNDMIRAVCAGSPQ